MFKCFDFLEQRKKSFITHKYCLASCSEINERSITDIAWVGIILSSTSAKSITAYCLDEHQNLMTDTDEIDEYIYDIYNYVTQAFILLQLL